MMLLHNLQNKHVEVGRNRRMATYLKFMLGDKEVHRGGRGQ
jgi:hypothetical protein